MSDALSALFEKAGASLLRLAPGAVLFFAGDPVRSLYLIHSGEAALIRHTAAGAPVHLQRARPGMVLAEASAYSQTYHCDGVVSAAGQALVLPRVRFLAALAADPGTGRVWAAHLAREVQVARMRAEIRTLRTVTERLEAWLGEGGTLPPKGQWQGLATELGVTREALYRELARRRDPP